MKKITILMCAFCAIAFAKTEDTKENRIALTKEYLKAVNTEQMLSDMREAMSMAMPQNDQEAFKGIMARYINADLIEKITVDVMPEHFTAEEIEALTEFYASKNGKGIMAKMGPYSADVGTKIFGEMGSLMQQIQKDLEEKKPA